MALSARIGRYVYIPWYDKNDSNQKSRLPNCVHAGAYARMTGDKEGQGDVIVNLPAGFAASAAPGKPPRPHAPRQEIPARLNSVSAVATKTGCEEIYTLVNSTFNMCFTLYYLWPHRLQRKLMLPAREAMLQSDR